MLLWKLLLFNFFTFSIGLVSTSGHLWKQQRTFTLNALRHFGFGKRSIESKIVEEAGFFVEVLEKNKGLPVCNEDSIREAITPSRMSPVQLYLGSALVMMTRHS